MSSSTNRWLFRGVIVLVVLLAVFGVYKVASYDPTGGLTVTSVSADDWTQGTPGKPVFIEYSDFQCPACGAYYPLLKQVLPEFSGQIQFVYRHFPLTQIHKNALAGAYAAEAAGKQGKFWEMHDMLFEHQKEWSEGDTPQTFLEQYAQKLGLNVDQFKKDSVSSDIKDKVERSSKSGDAVKVPGTPTFFFNGKHIQTPGSVEALRAVLQYQLQHLNAK